MNPVQATSRVSRYEEDEGEPAAPYSFEGLAEGIWGMPSAIYHATIGKVVNLIRGKPSKLDKDAEGWNHLSNPDPGRGEKD
jgi:hypothetical protein